MGKGGEENGKEGRSNGKERGGVMGKRGEE